MDSALLVIVVVVALGFDFTNGFHDTANAVATSVSTRALTPRMAVLIAAVAKVEGFKDSQRELVELRELEDEGDRLNREGIAELFASGEDAIAIIRWKDIHEQLEEAMDACENAADVLEAIFVKNR